MTSVQLQDTEDILWTKGGRKPFGRVREEIQRDDPSFGDLERVLSDAGSRSRRHRLITIGEEALTCNLPVCPYRIGEHGFAPPAEYGVRLLPFFRRNCHAGMIRLKQQVRDRV